MSDSQKLVKYAQSLPPGTERARCYSIAQRLESPSRRTIAERVASPHFSADGPLRDARCMA